MNNYLCEESILKQEIRNGTALYYYRATPFTEHGDFNYNGALKEKFFFDNLFSKKGNCIKYINEIKASLLNRSHKSVLLTGNQGCGKTTFVHFLKNECNELNFIFFDFDKNTSHPQLSEYIELFSRYLLELLLSSDDVNTVFYDLYIRNKLLLETKINANNNVNEFFERFYISFIASKSNREDFIKIINQLFFNQILSLILLWHLCDFKCRKLTTREITPMIFCLDNLDVLINKEIIEKFFKEYFRFVRNVDSIIQNIDDNYIKDNNINYNKLFTFIFSCRQHTWARVREHYRHDNSFVRISTLERDITDAFDKKAILSRREEFIKDNIDYFGNFENSVSDLKAVLSDMDSEEKGHNIYDLFDDDYRQCNITFEEIVYENPAIIEEYLTVKNYSQGQKLYGARGIIYNAIFEKFKNEGLFNKIGVLDIDSERPLVSNARTLLNYLNYYTYDKNKLGLKTIPFDKIVKDFEGIINESDINKSLIAMFRLGDDSLWNELIAFKEIHSDNIKNCEATDIFITKAGHEYIDLISTHFEYFNTRVTKRRSYSGALFLEESSYKSNSSKYEYNFQETIQNVFDIVYNCCKKMSQYYDDIMKNRFKTKEDYLFSPYVYGDVGVLHGERIIHTHIRYIDYYRIYLMTRKFDDDTKKHINELLVGYIEKYINISDEYPDIVTSTSIEKLFPVFKEKIKIIKDSAYSDYTTKIDR